MADKSFQITLSFPATADGYDQAVEVLKFADGLGVPQAKALPLTPTQKAPAAAAPKSNAKGNSKKAPTPTPRTDPMDLSDMGGDNDDEEDTGGLGLADDLPGLTAAEAKEEALDRLRRILANGHKEHVKTVQKALGVAKFHDVPAEQGHEFLKKVIEVEQTIGRD